MELTVENLKRVKSFSDRYEGFYRVGFTFYDLIDFFFGRSVWDWEKVVFGGEKIVVVDIAAKLKQTEKELILNALELTGWNQQRAAKVLGIHQVNLNRRIKKYKITYHLWKKNREVTYVE